MQRNHESGHTRRSQAERAGPEHQPIGDITDAMHAVEASLADGDPERPDVSTLRTLMRAASLPMRFGDVAVIEADVRDGDPRNGAHMSTAHVSRLTATFPRECPNCGDGTATLRYRRYHNIAGSRSLRCSCGHVHEDKQWG